MAKKDYFLIVDTETTITDKVADFGAVVCDRKGRVYAQCAILVGGIFNDRENHALFHDKSTADSLWSKDRLNVRYSDYDTMIENGLRMMATVPAINRWLDKVKAKYDPYLTAYNLAFDSAKCRNTGIDLDQFTEKRFCLWHLAFGKYAHTKRYRQFILDNHCFNAPTKHGNMSFVTNAEVMTRFVTGQPDLEDEPHTAFEDVMGYELPILVDIVKKTKKSEWQNPKPFDWRKVQVRDWFQPK